ncbi:MAG: NUDIX hydrolase [Chloroflexota bacterium]
MSTVGIPSPAVADPPALPGGRSGAYAGVTVPVARILRSRFAPGYPAEGKWTLPGGGVDHGEHPDDAVLRELGEETGLAGTRGPVVSIWSGRIEKPMSRPGPLHWVAIIYRVSAELAPLRLEVGGSTDDCRWFSLDEAAGRPAVDMVAGALAALADGRF